MPINRFYLDKPLQNNSTELLEGEEFQHLTRVLRAREGEEIELVNGKGQLARGALESIQKKSALIKIIELFEKEAPTFQIVLAQGLPRINRLDTIIEKATELGANSILLYPGDHSERKELTDHQMERLRQISIAAMKQCGRFYLPEIQLKKPLKSWESLEYPAYYGDPFADRSFAEVWEAEPPEPGAIFFVGPETGFSESEEILLQDIGASGVSLHENILRTDTAAIIALSLLYEFRRSL